MIIDSSSSSITILSRRLSSGEFHFVDIAIGTFITRLFSHSQTSKSAVVLLFKQNIDHFVYDADQNTLFIVDNLTRVLRLYAPIHCNGSLEMRRQSWSLGHLADSIRSMEIDVLRGQLIFASMHQFLVANISTPNNTRVVYTSDRSIMRFVHGMADRIGSKKIEFCT